MTTKAVIVILIAVSSTVFAFEPPQYPQASRFDITAQNSVKDANTVIQSLQIQLRAAKEQARAAEEREKAAEEREKAAAARSGGVGLLKTEDLKRAYSKFPESSYAAFIHQFNLSEFFSMLPHDEEFPPVQNKGRRSQPSRKRLRDSEFRSTFQAAHLAPLGIECNKNWLTLCVPFFDTPSCDIKPAQRAAEYFMHGAEMQESNSTKVRRKCHTGFLHSLRNFLFWADQNSCLDLRPKIMFIPLVDNAGDYFIPTETQRYLVICMDAKSCTYSLVPAITNSSSDMNCTDPRAIRAMEIFNEYFVNVAGYLRGEEVLFEGNTSQYKAKANLSADFRLFLKSQHEIIVPKLPEQGKIAVLEIGPDSMHGNPHPFFLALRSMNAWLYFNHRAQAMPDWIAFLKNRYGQSTTHFADSLRTPLVLLTACRDHLGDTKTCLLCKSCEILNDPDKFEGVDLNILELARIYADDIESLSEADIDLLDKVKMRDGEEKDSDEEKDFSWSSDDAGAWQTPTSEHMISFASAGAEAVGPGGAGMDGVIHEGRDKLELR